MTRNQLFFYGTTKRLALMLLIGVAALQAVWAQEFTGALAPNPSLSSPLPPELQGAYRRYSQQPGSSQGQPSLHSSPNPQTINEPALAGGNQSRVSAPATNDFQIFIEQSLGKSLPLFGHNLFENVPSTFAPVDNVPMTADYIVGPGDEIVMRIWGQVDGDIRAVVDRNGSINIPKIGVVNVAGISYKDLPSHLKSALSRIYRNFELSVSLGQLRSIQVFVVGQAKRPGSYTISSMSTLINALFAAGGPSGKGSMRRIQLKRGNNSVVEFDLYELLLKGDKSKDARLLPGDVIFIPPVGPMAAISGSVNVPAIFELGGSSTTLAEILEWGGGLTSTALSHRAIVERIDAHKARTVQEFTLDGDGLKHTVHDGDLLTFVSVGPRFQNAITLRGFVAEPARYPYREGMRIKDLLPNKDAIVSRDFWRKRNTAAKSGTETANQATDINSAEKLRAEVKSSEEVNWDYAVIERIQDDLSTTLIPFNLRKAILDGDPTQNLVMKPGDIITIFSKDDIQVPVSKQSRYVRLEGELLQAGVYRVESGETLRQLVTRVGGLTPDSYLFGAEFTRESARVRQQQQLDEAVTRLERQLQRSAIDRTQVATTADEGKNAKQAIESQRAIVDKLRGVKATGRVVLDLPEENGQLKDLPDIALEDGDRFYVPNKPSVVSVFGAVYNQNSFVYHRQNRVSDYLAQAGGPTRDADAGELYLIRANGSVKSQKNEGWLGIKGNRTLPGDAVIVPERLEKFSFVKELKDWSQIIYQFALGAAGVKVLNDL